MNTWTKTAADTRPEADWPAAISDNIAWALLITTALLIFITIIASLFIQLVFFLGAF
mgnify:CR=1 FL=1